METRHAVVKGRNRLLLCCVLILLFVCASRVRSYSQPTGFVYSIGTYGDLRKMDIGLNVMATAKVPGLVRAVRIMAADISPDGKRLFLAVSSGGDPLVVVQTADLSIDRDMKVVFPTPPENWKQHFPLDIIAVSSEMLYWSDECYTADPTRPYSTLLIDLNEGIAKPVYDWGFDNESEIEISPDHEKTVLYAGGRLSVIRASTGEVLARMEHETIGQRRSIRWFDVDWNQNVVQCYTVPWEEGQASTEKLRIDMNSHQVVAREPLQVSPRVSWSALQWSGQQPISSKTYILDKNGSLLLFDHVKGQITKSFNSVVPKPLENSRLVPHVSPDENLILAQRNSVERFTDGRDSRNVSTLYAIDPKTGQITKTLDYPETVVAVLFGE
jgi:hypothetical protein